MNKHNPPLKHIVRPRPEGKAMRGSSSSSLARCLWLLACALPVFSLHLAFMTGSAFAATWPVPTSALSASLSFHESYSAGIHSYVHSGIDIPASAGMQISSPLAGTVRFTGTVPSGDSKSGVGSTQKTMNAVSIELADKRTITLMPFAAIDVQEGQQVQEGAVLGTLAVAGDISTQATHVHMGYKQGSTYLDPMQLFGTVTTGQNTTAPGLDGVGLVAAPATSGQIDEADISTGTAVPQATFAPEVQAETAFNDFQVAPTEGFGTIETGEYELKTKTAQLPAPVAYLAGLALDLVAACHDQLTALVNALASLSRGTGIPLPMLFAGVGFFALGALVVLAVISTKVLAPHLSSWVQARKRTLSSRVGGDSMQKLFPASGAAFMSRSRIARGR